MLVAASASKAPPGGPRVGVEAEKGMDGLGLSELRRSLGSAKEQTRRLPTAAIQRLVGRVLNHTSLSVPCGSPSSLPEVPGAPGTDRGAR